MASKAKGGAPPPDSASDQLYARLVEAAEGRATLSPEFSLPLLESLVTGEKALRQAALRCALREMNLHRACVLHRMLELASFRKSLEFTHQVSPDQVITTASPFRTKLDAASTLSDEELLDAVWIAPVDQVAKLGRDVLGRIAVAALARLRKIRESTGSRKLSTGSYQSLVRDDCLVAIWCFAHPDKDVEAHTAELRRELGTARQLLPKRGLADTHAFELFLLAPSVRRKELVIRIVESAAQDIPDHETLIRAVVLVESVTENFGPEERRRLGEISYQLWKPSKLADTARICAGAISAMFHRLNTQESLELLELCDRESNAELAKAAVAAVVRSNALITVPPPSWPPSSRQAITRVLVHHGQAETLEELLKNAADSRRTTITLNHEEIGSFLEIGETAASAGSVSCLRRVADLIIDAARSTPSRPWSFVGLVERLARPVAADALKDALVASAPMKEKPAIDDGLCVVAAAIARCQDITCIMGMPVPKDWRVVFACWTAAARVVELRQVVDACRDVSDQITSAVKRLSRNWEELTSSGLRQDAVRRMDLAARLKQAADRFSDAAERLRDCQRIADPYRRVAAGMAAAADELNQLPVPEREPMVKSSRIPEEEFDLSSLLASAGAVPERIKEIAVRAKGGPLGLLNSLMSDGGVLFRLPVEAARLCVDHATSHDALKTERLLGSLLKSAQTPAARRRLSDLKKAYHFSDDSVDSGGDTGVNGSSSSPDIQTELVSLSEWFEKAVHSERDIDILETNLRIQVGQLVAGELPLVEEMLSEHARLRSMLKDTIGLIGLEEAIGLHVSPQRVLPGRHRVLPSAEAPAEYRVVALGVALSEGSTICAPAVLEPIVTQRS